MADKKKNKSGSKGQKQKNKAPEQEQPKQELPEQELEDLKNTPAESGDEVHEAGKNEDGNAPDTPPDDTPENSPDDKPDNETAASAEESGTPDLNTSDEQADDEGDADEARQNQPPEKKSADSSDIDDLWDDDGSAPFSGAAESNSKTDDTQPDEMSFEEVDYAEDDDSGDAGLDFEALSFDDEPTDALRPQGAGDLASGLETGLTGQDEEAPTFNLADEAEKSGESQDTYQQPGDENRPAHEQFYLRVLHALRLSDDLNVDSLAVARIKELLEQKRMPQLAVRDLMNEQLIDQQQLARAVARSQNRMEIMTLQDLPESARMLRKELDGRVANTLRELRIIPLRDRARDDGSHELHLAHSSSMRDRVVEATLSDYLPGYEFVWHYAVGDVCGQFWVTDEEGTDLDEGMEAESLLDRIVTTAVDSKASDIHVDPNVKGENKATIKYRVDGSVRPREVITGDQLEKLRVRIENIARMPKVNQNHPNKGAFSRAGFDWRVQIQPHAGRKGPVPRIVIRRLNPDSLSMERLGYPKPFIHKIQAASRASNGVVFWTGPTGSGKTESIHSAVISVDPMGRGLSVHTIEDPPEKRVDGYAVQMEVAETDDARSGLELLKSSLRADPDVVIFGEVRDAAMAKLVFEAANTGHLVFSTLHTNTSIDAIIRLDELEIRGFLVSYIRGIAAQRLVRRLCTHCRQPMKKPDQWTQFCFDYYKVPLEGAQLYKANPDGCPNCGFTGYRGRIAVAEWLVPNKDLVNATAARDFTRLEEIATAAGWEPMGKMGVEHVKAGITDAEELGRVILELSVEIREKEEKGEIPGISKSTEDARV